MPAESTPGHRDEGRRSRGHRGLRAAAWAAAGIVALGGAGAGYVYLKLDGNIESLDIDRILGDDRPEEAGDGSENILVLGSDTRSGGNEELGGGPDGKSARSDTVMIVHVHEGRTRASVVSVPRDTLVDRPECTGTDGATHPAARAVMFNSAYATGGAACAVKTVESVTGLRMDHYLEIDFTGFRKLVDALGGVEVTTGEDIEDPDSHLRLKAGTHRLDGEQALGLVRTRHGVGDGSDLGRIRLQQAFLKALVRQAGEVGVLTGPKKLYDLADTATKAVTTDSALGSVNALVSFASGLKNITPAGLHMITMPVTYDPANANRVLIRKAEARQVWNALKNDDSIPKSATEGTATGETKGAVDAGQGRGELRGKPQTARGEQTTATPGFG
ncbi:LCP family protein [Streptomyces sp. SAI-229]|uniref:LCP family protein n=1 Tax=Streptomyces sp. SAI-229 TaxID=3377731 RepID=UPI003C7C6650